MGDNWAAAGLRGGEGRGAGWATQPVPLTVTPPKPGCGRLAFIGSRMRQTRGRLLCVRTRTGLVWICREPAWGRDGVGARAQEGRPERAEGPRLPGQWWLPTRSREGRDHVRVLWFLSRTQWPWGHRGASTAPSGLSPWKRLLPPSGHGAQPTATWQHPVPSAGSHSFFKYFSFSITVTHSSQCQVYEATRRSGDVGSAAHPAPPTVTTVSLRVHRDH